MISGLYISGDFFGLYTVPPQHLHLRKIAFTASLRDCTLFDSFLSLQTMERFRFQETGMFMKKPADLMQMFRVSMILPDHIKICFQHHTLVDTC